MTATRQSRHPSPLAPAPVTVTRRSFGCPLPPAPVTVTPRSFGSPLAPARVPRRSFGSPLAPVTVTGRSFGSPLPLAPVTVTAAWDALCEAAEDEAEWHIVSASAGIGPEAR